MAGSLGTLSKAYDNTKGSAGAYNKELRALKERAEDALKPILDKVKDTRKEIEETTRKIKDKSEEWKKYKTEAVRALSEVTYEIVKLRKEAEGINVKFNSEQNNRLAERYVAILREQKEAQTELNNLQAKQGTEDFDVAGSTAAQERVRALAKERELIELGVNRAALDNAVAYESMSQAEKIILDIQKQRNTELSENSAKMEAAIEKQKILEAQANQGRI